MEFDSSSLDFDSLEAEILKIKEHEKTLDEELSSLLLASSSEVWMQMDKSSEDLRLHMPNADFLNSTAAALATQISESNELAEKVSGMVRALDDRQMRVQKALALAEDVLNLQDCADGVEAALAREDLDAAAMHVRQFQQIDPAAAAGHDRHLQRVRKARALLKKRAVNGFTAAVEGGDGPGTARFCAMLGALGLGGEAVEGYLGFAQRTLDKEIAAALAAAPPGGGGGGSATEEDAPRRLSAGFNAAAAFLQNHLPTVMESLGAAGGDAELVRLVHGVAETHALEVLRDFKEAARLDRRMEDLGRRQNVWEQKLAALQREQQQGGGALSAAAGGGGGGTGVAAAGVVDPGWLGEMDDLLETTALLLQHTETYERFVRHCADRVAAARAERRRAAAAGAGGGGGGGGGGGLARRPQQGPAAAAAAKEAGGGGGGGGGRGGGGEEEGEAVLARGRGLAAAAAELGGRYAVLEGGALRAGLCQALALDAPLPGGGGGGDDGGGGGGLLSSCVEDAFYVVQRGAARALATGHAGAAAGALNLAAAALAETFLRAVVDRATALLERLALGADAPGVARLLGAGLQALTRDPSRAAAEQAAAFAGAVGGAVTSGLTTFGKGATPAKPRRRPGALDADEEEEERGGARAAAAAFAAAANDLEAAERYCGQLRESLQAEVARTFAPGSAAATGVLACLGELGGGGGGGGGGEGGGGAAAAFRRARGFVLGRLAQRLQPAVRVAVADDLVGAPAVRYDLDDAGFARCAAADPWCGALLRWADALLAPCLRGLCASNITIFLQHFTEHLAKTIEAELMKKRFTALGGLQLDREARALAAHFAAGGGLSRPGGAIGGGGGGANRALRDKFARLLQMAQLLNVDKPSDAIEFTQHSSESSKQHLSETEMGKILMLRVDFEDSDIKALGLSIL